MQLMQPRMGLPGATTMKCQQTCKSLTTRQKINLHAEFNNALDEDDVMQVTKRVIGCF